MMGWMMIFAFFAVVGAVLTLTLDPAAASISLRLSTIVFGILFLLSVLTRVVRGRI
jgi:hypothetical protein